MKDKPILLDPDLETKACLLMFAELMLAQSLLASPSDRFFDLMDAYWTEQIRCGRSSPTVASGYKRLLAIMRQCRDLLVGEAKFLEEFAETLRGEKAARPKLVPPLPVYGFGEKIPEIGKA